MQEYFEVGKIVNTFGIKGDVKVVPYTDDINRFEELKSVYIMKNNQLVEFEIENVRYQKNLVIIKFKNINDMNTAEKYKECYIQIPRKDAKRIPEGTYFIADIIGSKVVTDTGDDLGYVDEIYNTGSKDIFVVKNDDGKQILLPHIEEVILNIDIYEKVVTVHLLEGLI